MFTGFPKRMDNSLIQQFQELKNFGRKAFAVLIDPDKAVLQRIPAMIQKLEAARVDLILVGGSLVHGDEIHALVPLIKAHTRIPVVLFPGSLYQITPEADGILFLSLISGRNPDLLIGKHVEAAPILKKTRLEILPTGYMLIDSGRPTTANYMSGTLPVPRDKPDIATATAIAGQMLGLKLIYMDGGSGAEFPVSHDMIRAVSGQIDIPLLVGGGIRNPEKAEKAWEAGADIVVVGHAIEKDPEAGLIMEIADARTRFNLKYS